MQTIPNELKYASSTGGTISDVNLSNESGQNLYIEKSKIIKFSINNTQTSSGIVFYPMRNTSYGNVIMMPVAKAAGYFESQTISVSIDNPSPKKSLTIDDMGWTKEEVIAIRGLFGSFAEDWDDPAMDIYNDL